MIQRQPGIWYVDTDGVNYGPHGRNASGETAAAMHAEAQAPIGNRDPRFKDQGWSGSLEHGASAPGNSGFRGWSQ